MEKRALTILPDMTAVVSKDFLGGIGRTVSITFKASKTRLAVVISVVGTVSAFFLGGLNLRANKLTP